MLQDERSRRELSKSVFKSPKGSFFDRVMTVRLNQSNFGPNVWYCFFWLTFLYGIIWSNVPYYESLPKLVSIVLTEDLNTKPTREWLVTWYKSDHIKRVTATKRKLPNVKITEKYFANKNIKISSLDKNGVLIQQKVF